MERGHYRHFEFLMSSRCLSISAQGFESKLRPFAARLPSSLSSHHFPSLFRLHDQIRPKKQMASKYQSMHDGVKHPHQLQALRFSRCSSYFCQSQLLFVMPQLSFKSNLLHPAVFYLEFHLRAWIKKNKKKKFQYTSVGGQKAISQSQALACFSSFWLNVAFRDLKHNIFHSRVWKTSREKYWDSVAL